MRRCFIPLIAALLAGCSSPREASSHRASDSTFVPESYVRINNADSNHIQLQIAAREFAPKHSNSPVIWLTGVSHIGETNYYASLQKHLDAQTLVLYEGVGAAENQAANDSSTIAETKNGTAEEAPERSSTSGSLQSAMAKSLGLVFQLEAIDYGRQNFRNSDLSITQLRQLTAQTEASSGQPGATESFNDLLQAMEGSSWLDTLLQLALRLLGANPKFQALGRLALIDLLGQIQGDPSRLQGLPPEMKQLLEVLLQRRNEKVIADLKTQLPVVGRHGTIAIFFGTGHMPDLEARLRSELKYQPKREFWFTVFAVDLAAAKITSSEREFIDNFVKWQIGQAGAAKTEAR
jgi:hypothetical protein